VTGEGDHGLYAGGNVCVNKAVERFIVSGTLPAAGATCLGRALPNPDQSTFEAQGGTYRVRSSPAGVSSAPGTLPVPGTNPLVALRILSTLTP
jgi:hypothetical protein